MIIIFKITATCQGMQAPFILNLNKSNKLSLIIQPAYQAHSKHLTIPYSSGDALTDTISCILTECKQVLVIQ